jgi:protein TonB
MFARIAVSIPIGVAVTFALLFAMQLMISTGQDAVTDARNFRVVDMVRVERSEVVETKEAKPERPPTPPVPPERPTPDHGDQFDTLMSVSMSAPAIEATLATAGVGFGISDGEYLPIVKVAPVYPQRALARRLEGHVVLEFIVTRAGTVKDIVVVDSSAPIFEQPAIEAAEKFRYKPRVIDGEAVEVAGVRNVITFKMAS